MDVIADVLRMIRFEGALFLNGELHDPWCVDIPDGADLARALQPNAQRLAVCHLVTHGQCWAQLHGGEAVTLRAGDVVVFPHGDSHRLGSGLHHAAVNIDHMVRPRIPELALVRYGGAGERTVVVCGWFAYEGELPNPLTTTLPRLFCTALSRRPAWPWIEQSLAYALSEAGSQQPGSTVLANKAAEILFVESLRAYMESLPASQAGWLSGLRDGQVGHCLALMHADPARAWSVEALAQAVHMSRSVLAQRFTALVGAPPLQYLTRWRMAIACGSLRNGHSNLTQIAESAGYESAAAFNRAFKREYGISPGLWRRGIVPTRDALPLP